MHRAVVSLPDGLHAQVRWVAGELCAAAGLTVADGGPALTLDPAWDLRTAAATLARSEELGGAADEHGRFPAAASTLRAGAAPLDEIVLALREAATAAGVEPAPVYPGGARFAVALTHDIDTPWRWSGRGLLGAGARLKSALAARDSEAARVEVTGLARAPLHRLLGSDPNWSHDRFAASEQRHGFRSTCFVLAAHRDPHDGAAPEAYAARRARLVAELDALGLEVGLHASYTCLADERLVASERAVLAGCSAGRSPATAITTCACRGTRASARSTGSASRTTRHSATRSGPGRAPASRSRSGPGTSPRGSRCASSSCRSC